MGENVVGENMGYTKSHQVALDVTQYGDGGPWRRSSSP